MEEGVEEGEEEEGEGEEEEGEEGEEGEEAEGGGFVSGEGEGGLDSSGEVILEGCFQTKTKNKKQNRERKVDSFLFFHTISFS